MKKRVSMARMVLAGLMVYIGGLAGVASAADSTPIRIVWPYPAGGEVDGVLRLMAESMAADSGRSFIVENRTGAAGLIAMQAVASANPDGNTVLAVPMGAVALLPHTKKLPFSPLDTFVPVCQFAELGGYVFSSKHLGFKSFDDLLAYARQNPGKLSYSSGGIGTQVQKCCSEPSASRCCTCPTRDRPRPSGTSSPAAWM